MTINEETLMNAINEAERFVRNANNALDDIRKYETDMDAGIKWPHCTNVNSAAAKRSSMDLTRSLADLRRGHVYM